MDKNKLLIAKITDKINKYKKTGELTHTSFLNPAEQIEAETILRNIPHFAWGGYYDAERKIIIIGEISKGDGGISLKNCFGRRS